MRRHLAKSLWATGTLLAGVTVSGLAAAQSNGTLVVSHWGFNGELLEELLIQPFEEQYDVDVVLDTGNNADRLARVRIRGGGDVDLIYLADLYTQQAIDEGVFAEVDRDRIPNIAEIYPLAQAPYGEAYGPAYTVGRYGIIYDSAAVEEPIASWNDLWREDLAGRLSIPAVNTTAGLLIVLAAAERAGVDAFEDTDAAFASLAELEPSLLTTYSRSSELVNLFAQGEVVAAPAQDFAFASIQGAVPTAVWAELEDGPYANLNSINVIAGSDQAELAHAFINFQLSAEVQHAMAVNGVDAPVNTNVELTQEEAARWTYGEDVINSLRIPDYGRLNAVAQDWGDRWNEIFAQ